jgi:hypothetical protein
MEAEGKTLPCDLKLFKSVRHVCIRTDRFRKRKQDHASAMYKLSYSIKASQSPLREVT